jgi:hypothetical protein
MSIQPSVVFNPFTGELDFANTDAGSGGITSIQTDSGTAHAIGDAFVMNGSGAATVSSPSGNNILVTVSPLGGLSVVQISSSQTLIKNRIYFCNSPGGALLLALPSIASTTPGDQIIVMLDGATSFQITQVTGQQILYGDTPTMLGAGGYLLGDTLGDSVNLIAQTTSRWNVISPLGSVGVN